MIDRHNEDEHLCQDCGKELTEDDGDELCNDCDPPLCRYCNGTGEGQVDGSRCRACNGGYARKDPDWYDEDAENERYAR